MAASTEPHGLSSLSAEVQFARRLAGNQLKIRDRAVKKLKKWLALRSAVGKGFTEEDLLKLWKGLFYCMWMSDKPLVQEKLAETISHLVHSLSTVDMSLLFIRCFCLTMAREWNGIDSIRIEKYMMFVRRFLRQSLEFVCAREWDESAVQKLVRIFSEVILNANAGPTEMKVPLGLQLHFTEIFCEELAKIGKSKISHDVIGSFLSPFVENLAEGWESRLQDTIVTSVFHYLMEQSDVAISYKEGVTDDEVEGMEDESEEEEEMTALDPRAGGVDVMLPQLKVNYSNLADMLFKAGSKKGIRTQNRKCLYRLVKQFRDLANSIYPLAVTVKEFNPKPLDINAAVKRLYEFEESLKETKKKGKKRKVTDEESSDEEDDQTKTDSRDEELGNIYEYDHKNEGSKSDLHAEFPQNTENLGNKQNNKGNATAVKKGEKGKTKIKPLKKKQKTESAKDNENELQQKEEIQRKKMINVKTKKKVNQVKSIGIKRKEDTKERNLKKSKAMQASVNENSTKMKMNQQRTLAMSEIQQEQKENGNKLEIMKQRKQQQQETENKEKLLKEKWQKPKNKGTNATALIKEQQPLLKEKEKKETPMKEKQQENQKGKADNKTPIKKQVLQKEKDSNVTPSEERLGHKDNEKMSDIIQKLDNKNDSSVGLVISAKSHEQSLGSLDLSSSKNCGNIQTKENHCNSSEKGDHDVSVRNKDESVLKIEESSHVLAEKSEDFTTQLHVSENSVTESESDSVVLKCKTTKKLPESESIIVNNGTESSVQKNKWESMIADSTFDSLFSPKQKVKQWFEEETTWDDTETETAVHNKKQNRKQKLSQSLISSKSHHHSSISNADKKTKTVGKDLKRKNKKLERIVTRTPSSDFLRKSLSKIATPKAEVKKKKKSSFQVTSAPCTRKRVNFILSQNTAHGQEEYHASLRKSPGIPFNAKQMPAKGLLKPSPLSSPRLKLVKRLQNAENFASPKLAAFQK